MNTELPYSVCDTPDGVMICGPHARTVAENLSGGTVSSVYCIIRGNKVCVVDSGRFDRCYDLLADILRSQRLSLRYILLTHDHYDHVGNAARLREEFGGRIVAHTLDAPLLEDPLLPYDAEKMRAAYGLTLEAAYEDLGLSAAALSKARAVTEKFFSVPVQADVLVDRDTVLEFEGIDLQLLHTPGHSPGSLSVYLPQSRSAYTGDLTFWVNPCRPYPIGNAGQCRKSLERLRALAPAWCGPGHYGGIAAPGPWLEELTARHDALERDILRLLDTPRSAAEIRAVIFPEDPEDSFAPIPENSIQSVLLHLLQKEKILRLHGEGSILWKRN